MIDLLAKTTKTPEEVSLAASDAELLFKNLTTMDRIREDRKASTKDLSGHFQKKSTASSDDILALIESQVQERTAELTRKAHYDALTHLPNRAYFYEMLDTLVQRHTELGDKFTLLFLDLDGFKQVNDVLGHHIGDELLRHVSARLISSVREGDIVSRLGGDEFVVLLADTDQHDLIETICQRIIQETARAYWFEETEVKTSSSIGIARYPADASTTTELIENADSALYLSKSKGKKTFEFYDAQLARKESQDTQKTILQNQFNSALKANQFQLMAEPQFDLIQNKVSGVCLTAHWQNSPSESINLTDWLTLLKKSGWEDAMGLWLLDSGFFYLNQWQNTHPEWIVTIPVLEALWRSEDFLTLLNNHLQKYQVSANQIQLEFPSTEFETYDVLFSQILKNLNKASFQITLDGIGKVPLDLNLLASLTIREFKLDPQWVQKNIISATGQKWIRATVQLAKSLDACVIATDISTPSQAKILTEMGCSLGQGSLWGAPKPLQEI